MAGFASDFAAHTWSMLLDSAVWLLFGFLIAGVIHVLVPVQRAAVRLGGGTAGVLKASLLGIPLPLCSCSVIPVASEIRQSGAGRGAFVSFLISTPETGVDSIAISYALLGPVFAVVRPLAALLSAMAAGVLTNVVSPPAGPQSAGSASAGETTACDAACGCATTPQVAPQGRVAAALRYGLIDMFVDLSPWLIGGFVLAGLASTAIPPDFFARHVGAGLPAMLVMLVVGLPLYICATASTPVAAALIAQGLTPGAALVFLLAGPATNMATMLVVVKDAGTRALAAYLVTIAVVSVVLGLALDSVVTAMPGLIPSEAGRGDGPAHPVAVAGAVALLLLLINGLYRRFSPSERDRANTGRAAA